jgi:hypothetical protein
MKGIPMTKTTMTLSAIALAVAATTLAATQALAYKGDPAVKGPNYTAERHAAVTKAFESNDYSAWKSQMEGRGITRRITEQNFARFAEAHRLAVAGKTAEANAIRAELGLNQQRGDGMGKGTGICQGGMNR